MWWQTRLRRADFSHKIYSTISPHWVWVLLCWTMAGVELLCTLALIYIGNHGLDWPRLYELLAHSSPLCPRNCLSVPTAAGCRASSLILTRSLILPQVSHSQAAPPGPRRGGHSHWPVSSATCWFILSHSHCRVSLSTDFGGLNWTYLTDFQSWIRSVELQPQDCTARRKPVWKEQPRSKYYTVCCVHFLHRLPT